MKSKKTFSILYWNDKFNIPLPIYKQLVLIIPPFTSGDRSSDIPAQSALPSRRALVPRRDDGQHLRHQAGSPGQDGQPGGEQDGECGDSGPSCWLEMSALSPTWGPLWRLQSLHRPPGIMLRSYNADYTDIIGFGRDRISNKVCFLVWMKPYKSVANFERH